MVKFELLDEKRRPAFRLPITRQTLCLLDTGALISVWCMPVFWLLKCYPNARKTHYCTTVSGFGGKSLKKREVWSIPDFELLDDNGVDKYAVKNLLVAVVDDSSVASFSLVLSSLIFHGSSYRIYDEIGDKRIEIYPKYNRPVFCVPDGYVDLEAYDEKIQDSIQLEDGESIIAGTTVFYEEENA